MRHAHDASMFPAHAGMNRASTVRSATRRRVPRTRGDEPVRGRRMRRHDAFPAHAGMNRQRDHRSATFDCVPRTRGDEPAIQRAHRSAVDAFPAHAGMNRSISSIPRYACSVPRTRGDEPAAEHIEGDRRAFPAHAGMNRFCIGRTRIHGAFPARVNRRRTRSAWEIHSGALANMFSDFRDECCNVCDILI